MITLSKHSREARSRTATIDKVPSPNPTCTRKRAEQKRQEQNKQCDRGRRQGGLLVMLADKQKKQGDGGGGADWLRHSHVRSVRVPRQMLCVRMSKTIAKYLHIGLTRCSFHGLRGYFRADVSLIYT